LLDLLPTRGPRAFDLFVECLREEYDWLADALEEEIDDEAVDDVDSSQYENVRKLSLNLK
jgi:hypothetical protein